MVEGLLSFVKSFVALGENRRRHARHERVTYISIQPLSDELSAIDEEIWGMTRDVSKGGVGFTTHSEIVRQYVRIFIPEDQLTWIGQLRHQRLISPPGEIELYFVGVELLDDFCCHY